MNGGGGKLGSRAELPAGLAPAVLGGPEYNGIGNGRNRR